VRNPLAGRLNGYALLQALRPVLIASGVSLYEHTHVTTLVLATNGYTPALGFFRNAVLPLHSHVLATAPLDDATWQRLAWGDSDSFSDDLARVAYATRTPGGRLLLGGGNPAYSYHYGSKVVTTPEAIARSQPFMQRILHRYFPAAAHVPIERRWSGVLGLTLDRQCGIGRGHVGRRRARARRRARRTSRREATAPTAREPALMRSA
jgi:glycine/D-amino acid oxidase-like deaminating enzyme